MMYFTGIDVSLRSVSISIVDESMARYATKPRPQRNELRMHSA
jgi:hypothetical protein